MNRILFIIGASGRTGRECVREALRRGWTVRAPVRRPEGAFSPHASLEVLQGDILDAGSLEQAMEGATAALSCIGHAPDSPAALTAPGAANLIAAMKKHGVTRLACVTGCLIGHPREHLRGIYRLPFEFGEKMKAMLADRREQERLIMASGLDWTIVRPPRLTNGPAKGRYATGPDLRIGTFSSISRADLAYCLLDCLENPDTVGKAFAIRY
ncbi:MAG: hypothetical protein GMKNLPBB_02821 [Myxococcota bacterium]|nr:hypothetical protein [Myxococcota bacterium]